MADNNYFFRVPFAVEGDIAEILQALQTDGTVSMQTGFTFDYERDPSSDPNAKDVPRAETNWLYYVITAALRQYQTDGTFPFITPEMNGGNPFPYIRNARCFYVGEVCESLVDNNTATPTDGTKWKRISGQPAVYELCEFYSFRHPVVRSGFAPAQGGLIENAATTYPEAWAYLQTTEGRLLCKTEAEWQAMTTATWATLADGTKVGWNGIGGAPFYAPNTATGALRLPDIRGMYAEAAGFDSLGVGGVHGDAVRAALGSLARIQNSTTSNVSAEGVFYVSGVQASSLAGSPGRGEAYANFDISRAMPVANKIQPRAFGVLPCVYLGTPK